MTSIRDARRVCKRISQKLIQAADNVIEFVGKAAERAGFFPGKH